MQGKLAGKYLLLVLTDWVFTVLVSILLIFFLCEKFLLNKNFIGADIDTLCVVPRHVTREDFFSDMHDSLNSLSEVTELTVSMRLF